MSTSVRFPFLRMLYRSVSKEKSMSKIHLSPKIKQSFPGVEPTQGVLSYIPLESLAPQSIGIVFE